MKELKRAIIYNSRCFSKTFIVFLVVFVLGNLLYLGIFMKKEAKILTQQIKSQLGAKVSFVHKEINNEGYRMDTQEDLDLFKEYEKNVNHLIRNQYVDYGNYAYMLELFDNEKSICYGYGISHTLIELQENAIELIEGREFTSNEVEQGDDVTIVSKDFLLKHHLQLNDEIAMKLSYEESVCNETRCESVSRYDESYSLKIVGVFEKIDKAFDLNNQGFKDIQNRMYMPNQTIWKIFERKNELNEIHHVTSFKHLGIDQPFIRLKNSDDLDLFEKEVRQWLPAEGNDYNKGKLVVLDDEYDDISSQVKMLNQIGEIIIVGSIIVFVLMLTFLVLLTIKERIKELGILLSLGEKKRNLILQLLFEMILVSFPGICVSQISGQFIWILFQKIIFQSDTNVVFVIQTQMIFLSFLVIIISMIYPSIKIFKLNAKKILLDT